MPGGRLIDVEEKDDGSNKMMGVEEAKMGCFQILQAVNEQAKSDERPVEIRKSTLLNGGDGLFATRDIVKGEYITTYPVCWIVVTEGEKRSYACAEKCYIDYKKLVNEGYLDEVCGHYSVGLFEDFTILGDPNIREDNRLVGHLINDLSLVEGGYDIEERNVAFSFLDIHAVKDIKKDEELSVAYGEEYWDTKLPDGSTRRENVFERLDLMDTDSLSIEERIIRDNDPDAGEYTMVEKQSP
jgi:hypothetical protein